MVTGFVLPADEEKAPYQREFVELADYQAAVGGFIEAIALRNIRSLMYANEEGKPQGKLFNRRATILWWFHVPQARGADLIVGDVVLVGASRSGSTIPLAAELVAAFSGRGSFQVDYRLGAETRWRKWPGSFDSYFDASGTAMLVSLDEPTIRDVRVSSA